MSIKELFELSIENQQIDLQALIMLLVFEKKVLSMESDESELDLYFLPKHRKRMSAEIEQYKKSMNLKYGLNAYEVKEGRMIYYIASQNEKHARYIAAKEKITVDEISPYNPDELMTYEGMNIKLKDLMDKPKLLGGF